jgi:diguanylate cyclase (GGDEF)-like protein
MVASPGVGADGVDDLGAGFPAAPAEPRPRSERIGQAALFTYIAVAIGGAVAALVLTAPGDHVSGAQLLMFAVLIVTAAGYDVVARRIERVRRRTSVGPFFTMNSVWTFCGAVVLPAWLAAVVGAFVFVQEEVQARLADNPKPAYRVLFNISAVAVPCLAVHHLVDWQRLLDQPPAASGVELPAAVIGGLLVYALTNAAMVSGVIVLARRSRDALRSAVGSASDNLLELATLALGGLLAVAIWNSVWLIVLVLPILVLLQRIALVGHLESAASSDGKTGLLNAAAWSHVAERELVRNSAQEKPAAVMIIDLDHFKQVNDVYGHLSGDAVLKAVADCMSNVLRDRDLLSRFGGEEFVALLPDADASEALLVAERLRKRIAEVVVEHQGDPTASVTHVGGEVFTAVDSPEQIRVTVSIGLASFPDQGTDLTILLAKADAALYEAKRAGRNRVHTSY